MGRTLKGHDYVFWCGDFNYRIDMDKDEMKEFIKAGDLRPVLENDQLRVSNIYELDKLRDKQCNHSQKQQDAGSVFNDFLEGEISFPPTYKYDLFSEDYDTSEKCRAPAWTDRVLWRRRIQQQDADNPNFNHGKLLHYGRAELKQSDHRPVVAILDIEYAIIDTDRRARVFNEVMLDLGPPDATVVIQAENQHSNDDEESIYDENVTAELVQELSEIGPVTLVRFVGETMWVTFKEGQAALAAVKHKGNIQVCGIDLSIQLKTGDWLKRVEKEIGLCTTNCVQLCEYKDISPASDYNSIGIPLLPSDPMKKKPPGRPALPKSPQVTPKHQQAKPAVS